MANQIFISVLAARIARMQQCPTNVPEKISGFKQQHRRGVNTYPKHADEIVSESLSKVELSNRQVQIAMRGGVEITSA